MGARASDDEKRRRKGRWSLLPTCSTYSTGPANGASPPSSAAGNGQSPPQHKWLGMATSVAPRILKPLGSFSSKRGPRTSGSTSPGNLFTHSHSWAPPPDQMLWGRGPGICVLASPSGDRSHLPHHGKAKKNPNLTIKIKTLLNYHLTLS